MDLVLIRQLELIQEYVDLSLKGEVHQKEGYLQLAKARYVEGPNSVSKVYLPTEDSEEYEALVTVGFSENKDHDKETNCTRVLLEDKTSSEHKNKLIRQFGILSPPCVKIAQNNFRQNLALCIDRVNVMEELTKVQKEFQSLQHVKNLLIKNHIPEP